MIKLDSRLARRGLGLAAAVAALAFPPQASMALAISQGSQRGIIAILKPGRTGIKDPGPVQAPGATGMINPGPVGKAGRNRTRASAPQTEVSAGHGGLIGLLKPGGQAPAPQKTR